MLKEVAVKAKYTILFQAWFESISKLLNSADPSPTYELSDQTWLKEKLVHMPLLQEPLNVKGSFQFIKPSEIVMLGSFVTSCALGPNICVDVMLDMPKQCFLQSDCLNERYLRKRALYLCCTASLLQQSGLVEAAYFAPCQGDPHRPVLQLRPTGKLGKRMSVCVRLSPQPGTFKMTRFSPTKNNVRPSWFFGTQDTDEDLLPSTPHRNHTMVQDLVQLENDRFCQSVLADYANIKDGIKLLKVWLKQRELDKGYGSFSSWQLMLLVCYLIQKKRLSVMGSSYQVARVTWVYLSQSKWNEDGISLAEPSEHLPSLSTFHQHFDVVFVDVTGYCNVCADMSLATYLRVKRESELAVKCLDTPDINSFHVLFMTTMPFYRQFDHIVCLRNLDADRRLDHGPHGLPAASREVLSVLRKGLGERVSAVVPALLQPAAWSCSQPPPARERSLVLGLGLNPEATHGVVTKGPQANTAEAKEFQEFWGSRSELRRFRDGSICEAVVWSGNTLAERRLLCRQIVEYLLQHKLGLAGSDILYIADQFEDLIKQKMLVPEGFEYGTGEEAALAVLRAFGELAEDVRELKNMPLDVTGVQGTDSVFSYTDTFPPLATRYSATSTKVTVDGPRCRLLNPKTGLAPRWVPAVRGVIHLALSNKWPNDLDAVRRIKAAFYIELAKKLSEQCDTTALPFTTHVDILKNGFVFRLQLAYPSEVGLLKKQVSPQGVTSYVDTEESLALEKAIVHMPTLTAALHRVHQQHPSYGPACCLAKRWLSSQLLDPRHFPDAVTELLVAWLYLCPEPCQPPMQPQLAFFRFLHLVSSTNWSSEPIILNFNNEMMREEVLEIETSFQQSRGTRPPLFIATSYHRSGCEWTRDAPTLQILVRVAMLAAAALKVVEGRLLTDNLDQRLIFRHSLSTYDVVIHLRPLLNPRRYEAVDVGSDANPFRLPPYTHANDEKLPVVNFNPVELYITELREIYSEYALFFYDCYGGNVIGVLWIPSAKEKSDFKVSRINAHKLVGQNQKIELNTDALVEDFVILGDKLVRNVEVKS
ncbi:nucleolar protein 6 isoform X2 [Bacillus rossius redtenbacheri]